MKFISRRSDLKHYYNNNKVLMIASTGRSGSSMLTSVVESQGIDLTVLKSHFLPLPPQYKGKVIFIFSNPDLAAESALHKTLGSAVWGLRHFNNMESSDKLWLKRIGSTKLQTLNHNLLAYDALGVHKQLSRWLHEDVTTCDPAKAQILAIKYEHLWEKETLEEIKTFLKMDTLTLPPKRERGYRLSELSDKELNFRSYYNRGSFNKPRYRAYDSARELWNKAPPFQYLKFNSV